MKHCFYRKHSLLVVAVGLAASVIIFGTVAPASGQVPVGGSGANVTGVFGPVVTWPIIPLHAGLLPDGRVINYGTDTSGNQGAQFIYDVWNPALGTGTNSHSVLSNTTSTDIFCSGLSLMLNGNVLITGGDLTVSGQRNMANNLTTTFTPSTNTIAAGTPMNFPRWYPSVISLPDGRKAVFGGWQNTVPPAPPNNPVIPASTPEVYDPTTQVWTALGGASSDAAFGGTTYSGNWYYPRCYVASGGSLFSLGADGTTYTVSTAGTGSITQLATTVPGGSNILPTIPFAPGKLLSVRSNQVFVVDYSQPSNPIVTQTDNIDQYRYYASGTIMADGKVLVNGGSTVPNQLTGVAYQVEIWDPATGHWTAGASAAEPRLYHSNALLLTDASVLTGGGGAPGPLTNLNAEIYYPPYLYTSSGQPAVRPTITSVASTTVVPGATLSVTVGATDQISRLTFVRTGSATHDNNLEQRFINLSFQQSGQQLTATLPSDPTVLVPGYYLLFAFNSAGVPSTAQVIFVNTGGPPPPPSPFVQANKGTPPNSQTSVQVAYNSAQTVGNLNVVFIAWNNNSGSVSSVTDTLGNTYTKAIGPTVSSVSPTRSQAVYYCSNIKSGSGNTVKVTMSAAEPWIDVRILEYKGPWSYDTSVGAIGSNSATASSGTVTSTANNDLLVSGTYSDAGTTGAGPGFAQRIITVNGASAEDEVSGTAGSYSDSTSLGGPTVWVSQMVAFKPTASARSPFVQANNGTPPDSQTSVQVAYNSAQTAGNLNVVFIAWNNNSGSVSSVTDTLGNTYTKGIGPTVSSVSPTRSQAVYYCSNIKGSSGNTVKVTMSAAEPWIDVRILEYTGPWVYDTSVGAIGSNSATASSGTVTSTANNDLLVSGTYSDAGTAGAGAGFTQRIYTVNGASAEDKVAGTAGSYTDSTSLGGPTVWVSQMVAFKP
jgi:hypothetical protein